MSIRCAELGIPAAIGVGNALFEKICNSKSTLFGPGSSKLEIVK